MYKLLIVDDEKFEREGMAEFIAWDHYDIEVVGTAWNGQDGYEKVQEQKPDIVLTDIKMPVMDGLGLIRKLETEYPDIEIIVLSGYGEYEYTSKAMEYGIKHYVLKPCDEEKIIPIVEKVKEEIDKKRGEKSRTTTIQKLLPLAKEQMFRNILLNREITQREYTAFTEEVDANAENVRLLGFRNPRRRFDTLEQFVLENILTELYGNEEVFLETSISEDVLFLIDGTDVQKVEASVRRILLEFSHISQQPIQVALSDSGNIEAVSRLYTQIRELFRMGEISGQQGLLQSDIFSIYEESSSKFFRYRELQKAEDYAGVLFEVYLANMKMNYRGLSVQQKKKIYGLAYEVVCEEKKCPSEFDWEYAEEEEWGLLCSMTDLMKEIDISSGKEQIRMRQILLAVYENFQNTELSIRYLAKEVLYMNEEHFGRVFVRYWNLKFSTWLRKVRIELAKAMIAYVTFGSPGWQNWLDIHRMVSILVKLSVWRPKCHQQNTVSSLRRKKPTVKKSVFFRLILF